MKAIIQNNEIVAVCKYDEDGEALIRHMKEENPNSKFEILDCNIIIKF